MSGWRTHEGKAVLLDRENVDTDQIIPARFMSTPRAAGYGRFLLHDLRHDPEGAALPDFPLNRHPGASVLVAGRNFGCGSSREAAVYALVDAGFRAVIAPSFGDIFAANAMNNGLLPARIAAEHAAKLAQAIGDQTADARIDLAAGRLRIADRDIPFDLDPTWREKLLNGWDDIDLTLAEGARIAAYRADLSARAPWRFPTAPTDKPTGEETTP